MDCPGCREPMLVLELDEVEVDYCPGCKGIWLDEGELELLLENSSKKDELLASFVTDKTTKEKPRKCPICLKKMEKVTFGRNRKILIDKCRKNDGLWFDKGELEEVIRMGSFDENNKVLNLLKDIFGQEK